MLHCDFESRSKLDIRKCGVDVYARNAEPLMMAYAIDDEPPKLWLRGDPLPEDLVLDPAITKAAHNAGFERAILRHCFGLDTPPSQWLDVPNLVRYATMPPKLKLACEYLQLGDLAKHDGSRLINKFCKPHKGRFVEPEEAPDDWETFKEYCKQDVVAEREILHRLQKTFSLTPFEQRVAQLDTEINERGIPVDRQFVDEARKLVAEEKCILNHELQVLTGLSNPNSPAQLLAWVRERGFPFNSLLKKRVDKAMQGELLPEVRRALELRGKLSRSSTAKLDALAERVSPDGRLRANYVYLGASRTGRWSSTGVNIQNLKR